jgi:HNH endonuclease
VLVTVDLDSLLGHPGGVGGEAGGTWPLDPEACRRLACDGAVTRVLVSRHQTHDPHPHGDAHLAARDPSGREGLPAPDPTDEAGLAAQLQTAIRRLPPTLGGAPTQPLEVGRTSRVVTAAQRAALTVRDRGCGFPGCDRPPAWCEAHHLVHWLHGGPTDLANLALLCRAHHRAVHEGGWRLGRDPDGHLTATPPHRRPRAAA